MSEEPQGKASDTLVPQVITAEIDGEKYKIAPFCLAKTILAFELITDLTEAVGVTEVMAAANQEASNLELAALTGSASPGFVRRLFAILPQALREGKRPLYELLGLIITTNAKLRNLEENDEDIRDHLYRAGRTLAYAEGGNQQVIALVAAGVKQIGVESILGNVPSLLALLRTR